MRDAPEFCFNWHAGTEFLFLLRMMTRFPPAFSCAATLASIHLGKGLVLIDITSSLMCLDVAWNWHEEYVRSMCSTVEGGRLTKSSTIGRMHWDPTHTFIFTFYSSFIPWHVRWYRCRNLWQAPSFSTNLCTWRSGCPNNPRREQALRSKCIWYVKQHSCRIHR